MNIYDKCANILYYIRGTSGFLSRVLSFSNRKKRER